jgi:hypothetical protein
LQTPGLRRRRCHRPGQRLERDRRARRAPPSARVGESHGVALQLSRIASAVRRILAREP